MEGDEGKRGTTRPTYWWIPFIAAGCICMLAREEMVTRSLLVACMEQVEICSSGCVHVLRAGFMSVLAEMLGRAGGWELQAGCVHGKAFVADLGHDEELVVGSIKLAACMWMA